MTIQFASSAFNSVAQRHTLHPCAASRRKRALDVSVALVALVLFLPLMAAVALAILLEGEGPVLYRQQRGGLGGRPFRIYKFRTMRTRMDGDDLRQAERGDARVTAVGAVLRKLSLDELPQLLNVLKGEMALVGPRPHALTHDRQWAGCDPTYAERFRVRPGLTGYAQVLGYRGQILSDACVRRRTGADNAYIDGWTLGWDIELMLRTAPLLFGDRAAY